MVSFLMRRKLGEGGDRVWHLALFDRTIVSYLPGWVPDGTVGLLGYELKAVVTWPKIEMSLSVGWLHRAAKWQESRKTRVYIWVVPLTLASSKWIHGTSVSLVHTQQMTSFLHLPDALPAWLWLECSCFYLFYKRSALGYLPKVSPEAESLHSLEGRISECQ